MDHDTEDRLFAPIPAPAPSAAIRATVMRWTLEDGRTRYAVHLMDQGRRYTTATAYTTLRAALQALAGVLARVDLGMSLDHQMDKVRQMDGNG